MYTFSNKFYENDKITEPIIFSSSYAALTMLLTKSIPDWKPLFPEKITENDWELIKMK